MRKADPAPTLKRNGSPMPIGNLDALHVAKLTEAEKAVLRLIAAGLTDEEVAEALAIKVSAVRGRMKRFHAKSGISGRAEVAWAIGHKACCLAA